MKYVLTGKNGFIGKNIFNKISEDRNNEILSINRDYSDISKILKFKPDYIIHTAAEIYDESRMIDSNILFTYRLLESIKYLKIISFIYLGSSSEYGLKDKPMSEDDFLKPRNLYESTKASCTLMCQSYANTYSLPIVTLRLFSVYGQYEKSHRFIPTLFNSFLEKKEIRISPGNHDYIYVDDVVDIIMEIKDLIKNKNLYGDIINVGSGVQYSNYDVYRIFVEIFGYEIPVVKQDELMRKYDSDFWVADITKLKKNYGLNIKTNFKDGIQELYNKRIK